MDQSVKPIQAPGVVEIVVDLLQAFGRRVPDLIPAMIDGYKLTSCLMEPTPFDLQMIRESGPVTINTSFEKQLLLVVISFDKVGGVGVKKFAHAI